jgi:hypothetical protein
MRRLVVTLVSLALLAGPASAAATAKGTPKPPQIPAIPGKWSHAEINVKIKGVPHTLILDRGRIIQVSETQLTLREPDGSVVAVPLSPSTLIAFRGFGLQPVVIRRGLWAVAMRIDDGAAVRVRVTRLP